MENPVNKRCRCTPLPADSADNSYQHRRYFLMLLAEDQAVAVRSLQMLLKASWRMMSCTKTRADEQPHASLFLPLI